MREIPDELLMAYVDGELPAAEWRRVHEAAHDDPAVARRLVEFIGTGRNLARAYDPVLQAPLPDDLLRMIDAAAAVAQNASRSIEPPRRSTIQPRERFREWIGMPVWSLAAIPLLLGGGWIAHAYLQKERIVTVERVVTVDRMVHVPADGPLSFQDGRLASSADFRKALSETPRGQVAMLDAYPGVSVTPGSVFRSIENRWCRDYALTYTGAHKAWGIACRADKGTWVIDFHTGAPEIQDHTSVAGTEPQGFQAARDRLVGPYASEAEELKLMEAWKSNP